MTTLEFVKWYFSLSENFQKFLETFEITCTTNPNDLKTIEIDLSNCQCEYNTEWLIPLNVVKTNLLTVSDEDYNYKEYRQFVKSILNDIIPITEIGIKTAFTIGEHWVTNCKCVPSDFIYLPILVYLYHYYKISTDSKLLLQINHITCETFVKYYNRIIDDINKNSELVTKIKKENFKVVNFDPSLTPIKIDILIFAPNCNLGYSENTVTNVVNKIDKKFIKTVCSADVSYELLETKVYKF